MVAREKGFFAEAGLPEVKLQWWKEGESPLTLLTEGRADLCTAWLSQAIASRARGAKIVNLAQVMQRSALMLVTRRGSGIVKPEDMTGRRVGLWGVDFDIQPAAFFAQYDLRPQIVLQSASMAPFLRGAVDVASAMYYNEYHKLMEAGLRPDELRTFHFSDHGMNFPEDGIYCTEATRRQETDVCGAMASASLKGWAYAAEHEAEALDDHARVRFQSGRVVRHTRTRRGGQGNDLGPARRQTGAGLPCRRANVDGIRADPVLRMVSCGGDP